MKNTPYYNQAALLLRILPLIYKQKEFALKGGTAINFFVRDFPRLSVDIDLVYIPILNRQSTVENINGLLDDLNFKIKKSISDSIIVSHIKNSYCSKLTVRTPNATIKIEPNFNIRGTVYPTVDRELTPTAIDMFETYVKCQCVSDPDLYGGKICAALDRQHPRDLFDIELLLENEGITEEIKNAFIFYLLSHNRPIADVINPNLQDIKEKYLKEFMGMTSISIELDQLISTRKQLIQEIKDSLSIKDKQFILSFKSGNPSWELSPINDLKTFPSIQWKLQNINRMNKDKHFEAFKKLELFLNI